jgi:hypothetical protein
MELINKILLIIMKQNIISILLRSLALSAFSFFYLACSSNNSKVPTEVSIDTIMQVPIPTIDQGNNDTVFLINSIKHFLTWYKVNYAKANGFKFTYSDVKGNYQVDITECEKYLQFLQSSGYISENYTADWRKYFDSKVEYFKDTPQNEGPPDGFGMDLVLLTQEPELILNAIDKLQFKTKEIKNINAIIEVSGESMYEFEMSKIDGQWIIDYIATQNYD